MPGDARLVVDCGATHTTALVSRPAGPWTVLTVDGVTRSSSAVAVNADGTIVAGPGAWRDPTDGRGGFVSAPLRLGRDRAVVGGVDVLVADLVGATLRRIAEAAAAAAGGPVGEVRLVVPAGWGPRQRTWLRQAAHRAELAQTSLIDAPVAAADRVTMDGTIRPLVGDFLLVCDLGAGCEASVLRRTAVGFEVLSTLADPDAGGTAVDDQLIGWLANAGNGDSPAARLAAVRAAKEALANHPAVTVALPPPAEPTVLTAAGLDGVAQPVWERAGRLAVEAVAAADLTPDQLAAVVCVGGSAAAPAAVEAVAAAVGRAPVVPEDPATVAAWGAAGAAPAAGPAAAGRAVAWPSLRQAGAIAVAGLASLALLAHFLLSAQFNNGGRVYRQVHFYIVVNWGELAVASVCVMLACLAATSVLATLLAAERGAALDGPGYGTGVLAATAFGVAIGGLYAIFGSLYFILPAGPFLRWSLLPVAPVAVLAVATAVVAARSGRIPAEGWQQWSRLPVGSLVAAAAGMLAVQYSVTATRWPHLVLLIDVVGRLGGVLIGVALALALVSQPLHRFILAMPLGVFGAATAGMPATGVFAVMYALAVSVWWGRRLWQLVRSPVADPARVG